MGSGVPHPPYCLKPCALLVVHSISKEKKFFNCQRETKQKLITLLPIRKHFSKYWILSSSIHQNDLGDLSEIQVRVHYSVGQGNNVHLKQALSGD